MTDDKLPFTGERFTPECVREIWYEHWHRYAFALRLAQGKRVLDAACGEGYGSALLATVASTVVGVDLDQNSIDHARVRYGNAAELRFERADVTDLPFPSGSFDLIVCLETLEHLAAHEELIQGFARLLADDGVLLISSPDKRTYSDMTGFHNEFHVRELYRDELLALLQPLFQKIRLYGQKLLFQSALWLLDSTIGEGEAWTAAEDGESLHHGFDYAPLYYVAVCAKSDLPQGLPDLSLFGDRKESVYGHYNHEVKKNIMAGSRIAELESELEHLRRSLMQRNSSSAFSDRWRRFHWFRK